MNNKPRYSVLGLEKQWDGGYWLYTFYSNTLEESKETVENFLAGGDIGVVYCLAQDVAKHKQELELTKLLVK